MVFLSICSRSQRYSVGFFCREILRLSSVLYPIVLSSMMLFKRSFGLTRSLFILYVHEHDCLGSGLYLIRLHLLILMALIAKEKVSRFQSNIIWNRWKSSLRALIRPWGNTRISCTEFDYDERARDCKCILRFELPAQNNIRKNILLQISFCA